MLMNLLINWLLSTLAIIITAYLLPGAHVRDVKTALLAALVLGIINAILKPILIILTLPINILTLGLFTFVINALIILLTADLVKEFHVDGFWWAMLFSIVLSIINAILHQISKGLA